METSVIGEATWGARFFWSLMIVAGIGSVIMFWVSSLNGDDDDEE